METATLIQGLASWTHLPGPSVLRHVRPGAGRGHGGILVQARHGPGSHQQDLGSSSKVVLKKEGQFT